MAEILYVCRIDVLYAELKLRISHSVAECLLACIGPNLRLNLTSRQRLGLRIFLGRILVLDFCLSGDLSQQNC